METGARASVTIVAQVSASSAQARPRARVPAHALCARGVSSRKRSLFSRAVAVAADNELDFAAVWTELGFPVVVWVIRSDTVDDTPDEDDSDSNDSGDCWETDDGNNR